MQCFMRNSETTPHQSRSLRFQMHDAQSDREGVAPSSYASQQYGHLSIKIEHSACDACICRKRVLACSRVVGDEGSLPRAADRGRRCRAEELHQHRARDERVDRLVEGSWQPVRRAEGEERRAELAHVAYEHAIEPNVDTAVAAPRAFCCDGGNGLGGGGGGGTVMICVSEFANLSLRVSVVGVATEPAAAFASPFVLPQFAPAPPPMPHRKRPSVLTSAEFMAVFMKKPPITRPMKESSTRGGVGGIVTGSVMNAGAKMTASQTDNSWQPGAKKAATSSAARGRLERSARSAPNPPSIPTML
eukprot:1873784-Pleurochrysis_carterae.AAC.2